MVECGLLKLTGFKGTPSTLETTMTTDADLANLLRTTNMLVRRVIDGKLPVNRVLAALERIIESSPDTVPRMGFNRIIDCDARPRVMYEDWKVEEHIPGGEIEFDPSKVELFLHPDQRGLKKKISGYKLRERLKDRCVMNACVLDHLVENPGLIPESWKKVGEIFFWGTVYRGDYGLHVRSLRWQARQWRDDSAPLQYNWGSKRPAAIWSA